jgi:hypothetical protein
MTWVELPENVENPMSTKGGSQCEIGIMACSVNPELYSNLLNVEFQK